MIKAKRFSFLDEETNVAVAPFSSDTSSSVYNSAKNALKDVNSNLDSLIDSSTQKLGELGAKAESIDSFDDVARFTKDALGAVGDLSKMPQKAVDDFLATISLKDATAAKGLKNMLSKCKNKGTGYGVPGKPWDASLNCGKGNIKVDSKKGSSTCDAGSFSDLLNKLTGGAYGSVFKDAQSAMKALMALAGYGYNMGMCGVFGALSEKLDLNNDQLSRAMGGLMSIMGKKGSTTSWLDLASSSAGLLPLASSPSAIGDFLGNFTVPDGYTEFDFTNLASRTGAGLELVDEQWNISGATGELSIAATEGGTYDLGSVFNTQLTNRAFTDDSLDVAPSSDDDFTWGAFAMA